jgi:tRNA pseudouridine55 synthase
MNNRNSPEGILLVDKPKGAPSFSLITALRRRLAIQKIGHAGTLDPFATGVMVLLVGRRFTQLSDLFLCKDKEYRAQVYLGITTNTYDCEGEVISHSPFIPSLEGIQEALHAFQGEQEQIPPMFSAKKIQGQKLYDLARRGKEIERPAVKVWIKMDLLSYQYPYLDLSITCSKGTYIRSLAFDLGIKLQCGAHLSNLQRTRSGSFLLQDCLNGLEIKNPNVNIEERLIQYSPF